MFQHKIVNMFLPIIFSICFGAQKNRLMEMVLLSTHNICFGLGNKNFFFCCFALLTKGLVHMDTNIYMYSVVSL